jgi:hypothetical protein
MQNVVFLIIFYFIKYYYNLDLTGRHFHIICYRVLMLSKFLDSVLHFKDVKYISEIHFLDIKYVYVILILISKYFVCNLYHLIIIENIVY